MGSLWVVRVMEDDGELRPWHFIYVCSIESRLETQIVTLASNLS
jgi:hypothetical protein